MADYMSYLTGSVDLPIWLTIIVLLWTLVWKGFALWKAAGKKSVVWFIVLLVVNTVGILEILYLFLFSKIKLDDPKGQRKRKKSVRKKKLS